MTTRTRRPEDGEGLSDIWVTFADGEGVTWRRGWVRGWPDPVPKEIDADAALVGSTAWPGLDWPADKDFEVSGEWDEPGEPKTGERIVPIPPELVAWLRSWIAEHNLASHQLLFRTRNDRRPTPSNWGRALKRACAKVGRAPIRVYDARHACATSWLGAGVPLGEVARRLGHSVETLVAVYVGALDGDDVASNRLIDTAAGDGRRWMLEA